MHYEKTYSQLLANLPPELRQSAIQYRQLKKVIRSIVGELSLLGLTPEVLHGLTGEAGTLLHKTEQSSLESFNFSSIPKVAYELNDGKSTRIEPQLRIWISIPPATFPLSKSASLMDLNPEPVVVNENGDNAISSLYHRWTWQQRISSAGERHSSEQDLAHVRQSGGATTISQDTTQEVVIPLVQDSKFYEMLTTTLTSVSLHLTTLQSDVLSSVQNLSNIISDSAHPASAASTFHPHSPLTANAGSVRVRTSKLKSDLYSWRKVFQLYLEAEVFESVGKRSGDERSVEESEKRLQLFVERLEREPGDKQKFKMKHSAEALTTFLSLNLFILNIKKLSLGNAEATRKILKKHTKRTALPPPLPASGVSHFQALLSCATSSFLSRTLIQAIGEMLIPIIPHIDDYSCLICTSIAFKPIRLTCGHLFCVRCLVKLQKRNKNLCPMCRAPSVLAANRDNVDWGLLNFMQDWFPLEAKEKLLSNEREATAEQLEELGIDPNRPCLLM